MRKAKLKKPRCGCDTSLIYIDAPGWVGGDVAGSGFSIATGMFVHVRDESDISVSGPAVYNVQLDVDYAGKVLVDKP